MAPLHMSHVLLTTLVALQLPEMLVAGPFDGIVNIKPPNVQVPNVVKAVESVKQSVEGEVATTGAAQDIKSEVSNVNREELAGDLGKLLAEEARKKEGLLSTKSLLKDAPKDLEQVAEVAKETVAIVKPRLTDVDKVAKAAAEVAESTVRDTPDKLSDLAEKVEDEVSGGSRPAAKAAQEAVSKAKSDGLASHIRKVAPKVAEAVSKTSLDMADTLARLGSDAAGYLNRTGHGIAKKMSGSEDAPAAIDLLPSLPTTGHGWAASLGMLSVALLLCTACMGFRPTGRGSGHRSLLNEILMGDLEGARAPSFRPPSEPVMELA